MLYNQKELYRNQNRHDLFYGRIFYYNFFLFYKIIDQLLKYLNVFIDCCDVASKFGEWTGRCCVP